MIVVLAGGPSSEREVSLWTATTITDALTQLGKNYQQIDCRDSNWLEQLRKIKPEVAILALHGKFGEDGTIQTILEQLNIPYTGSGPVTAAHAFNKVEAKLTAATLGIKTPKSTIVSERSDVDLDQIKVPVVVKPNQEGSSFGITLVWSPHHLEDAINVAFQYSSTVLIEEYIAGTELTSAVTDVFGHVQVLPLVEIRPHTEFFDFQAKYDTASCDEICPASTSEDLTRMIQDQSVALYQKLGCRQYARLDWIERDGVPYFLEINTLPGMTSTSLINKELAAAGIHFKDFIARLIETAPKIRQNRSK